MWGAGPSSRGSFGQGAVDGRRRLRENQRLPPPIRPGTCGPKRGDSCMPVIHVREEESFENALRRFKRKCEKAGILTELKKRQHYEKPSVKRKRKAIQARKKMLRKVQEERRLGLS